MTTHYLPFFTKPHPNLSDQRAVCGNYVDPMLHSTEPTCTECLVWLQQDAEPITEPKEKK